MRMERRAQRMTAAKPISEAPPVWSGEPAIGEPDAIAAIAANDDGRVTRRESCSGSPRGSPRPAHRARDRLSVTVTNGTPLGHAARCNGIVSRACATITSGRSVLITVIALSTESTGATAKRQLREDGFANRAAVRVLVGDEHQRRKAGSIVRAAAAARVPAAIQSLAKFGVGVHDAHPTAG